MSHFSFIKKQFIDVLQWNKDTEGVLAWPLPKEGFEIQNGAALTVRESQLAVFVNEGQIADVFGPGNYTLWIHGHVHDSFDYTVAGTRIVTNPRGYALNRRAATTPEQIRWENPAFQPALALEI